jgi:hypothetical protein
MVSPEAPQANRAVAAAGRCTGILARWRRRATGAGLLAALVAAALSVGAGEASAAALHPAGDLSVAAVLDTAAAAPDVTVTSDPSGRPAAVSGATRTADGTPIVEQQAVDPHSAAAAVLSATRHAGQVDPTALAAAQPMARPVPAAATASTKLSTSAGPATGGRIAGATPASTVTAAGSITYIWQNDVWITDSRGSAPIRVTTDGSVATTDGTGNTNYFAPTQSADGSTVVAVRNQNDSGAQTGWLWVMDRTGKVIRKIQPMQFQLQRLPDNRCVGATYSVFPMGLGNARIAPDGARVIYQQTVGMVSPYPSCVGTTGVFSFVTAIDGSSAAMVTRTGGDGSFLMIGGWTSNTRVLSTDMLFGSNSTYYSDLPSTTATLWYTDGETLDMAFHDPQVAGGHMATVGSSYYSQNANANLFDVIRFGNSAGPTALPTMQCEYRATHGVRTDLMPPNPMPNAVRPGLSPDGLGAVWQDSYGTADSAGEGIYVTQLPAGTLTGSSCSAASQQLITNGWDPSWSAAPLTLPTTATLTVAPAGHAAAGGIVTLTGTVAGGRGAPTGTVTFKDGDASIGAVSLDAHGTAVLALPSVGDGALLVGAHSFTLSYGGDSGHPARTAGPVAFTLDFPDVAPSSAFYGDVMWLVANGITTGYRDGGFHPGAPVTRQAMAAFLYRIAHGPASVTGCTTQTFWDVPTDSPFCGYISWLAGQGISTGYHDAGHALPGFHPGAAVTRQARSAFLYRMAEGSAEPTGCTTQSFWDVGLAGSFCPYISWMADNGISTGYLDAGKTVRGFHPGAPVSRQAMAAFLHRFAALLD